jgi:hypothetical protein
MISLLIAAATVIICSSLLFGERLVDWLTKKITGK